MPTIHVSSLSRLHQTVIDTGASHVVTLININTVVERPPSILPERYLFIGVSDIVVPLEGHVTPGEEHVSRLVDFVRDWDAKSPMVIHCWAGVSRSTAAAYIAACLLNPEQDEIKMAWRLRRASPSATPNPKLVAIADKMLGRQGRMVSAIAAIGRGEDAFEGHPFKMPLSEA